MNKSLVARASDYLIEQFSPIRAANREVARITLDAVRDTQEKLSAYKSAEESRLRSSWPVSIGSANADLIPELSKIRERCRDLSRNNAFAAGLIETNVTNIIGTGMKCQSFIHPEMVNMTEDEVYEMQSMIEENFGHWMEQCDIEGRKHFFDVQEQVCRTIDESGEAIVYIRRKRRKNKEFDLCLQVVESDRLESPEGDYGDIVGGIEHDEDGAPTAYYISNTHPGDVYWSYMGRQGYTRVAAYDSDGRPNILHIYRQLRPGQGRGIPLLSPVVSKMKDLDMYNEAELVAARVAACIAMFIRRNNPLGNSDANMTLDSEGLRRESLRPGIIERLGIGEEPVPFVPNRPGQTYDQFVQRILMEVAAGCNSSYEVLARDFSRLNYSSARVVLHEVRRHYIKRQRWLARTLLMPIWNLVLEEGYLKGFIKIPDFYQNKRAYCCMRVVADGWPWVDPEKEANSTVIALENNLSNLAEEIGSLGRDWDETIAQGEKELQTIKRKYPLTWERMQKDGTGTDIESEEMVPDEEVDSNESSGWSIRFSGASNSNNGNNH